MRRITARRALVPALVAIVTLATASIAAADPRYEVMNAPEGVYWRSEPNWAAAERITGFGVYDGTIVEVRCYQSGTAVEGSADTMWEQATDVGGRGYGSGWLNEHFINDGQPIDQPSPGVSPCNPPPPPPPPPPAGLVLTVFNAEGGIYYRNSPHWADTSQTPGVGVYDGDQVELICGALGDPVGPYSDTAWSYVKNLSRPSIGDGWVNEHFIDDGAFTGQFVFGEPLCGASIPGMSQPTGGSSGSGGGHDSNPCASATSVFYSPTPGVAGGIPGRSPAACNLSREAWSEGSSCLPNKALQNTPSTATILSGWSYGRLGPILYLAATAGDPARWSQIRTIVLFDPGDYNDFALPSCDAQIYPSINYLLASWLTSPGSHNLLILAGGATENISWWGLGSPTFHGLWHFYLADIWNQPFASQALICDYGNIPHPAVLEAFDWVARVPTSTCPTDSSLPSPIAWNP